MSLKGSKYKGSRKYSVMTPVVPLAQGTQSAHGIPDDDHSRTYCGKKVEGHWRENTGNVTCNRCRATMKKMLRSRII